MGTIRIQTRLRVLHNRSRINMKAFVVVAVIFSSSVAVDIPEGEISLRAAAKYENCFCQCSNLVFKDKYGNTHGNCKTVDSTGAAWCYVDPAYSSCKDLSKSRRFNANWSYEACATPALGSHQCPIVYEKSKESSLSDIIQTRAGFDPSSESSDNCFLKVFFLHIIANMFS